MINIQFGNILYGLREVEDNIYYFGPSVVECAAVTGKCRIDDGDDSSENLLSEYYFGDTGKGVTGMRDGCYYYKGKMQKAGKDQKYEAFDLPGVGIRLLNSSGKIMKNRTVTDAGDNKWTVSASGEIVTYGTESVSDVSEPEPITD